MGLESNNSAASIDSDCSLAAAMSQAYITCIRCAFVRTTKLRILHGEQMGRLGRLPEILPRSRATRCGLVSLSSKCKGSLRARCK